MRICVLVFLTFIGFSACEKKQSELVWNQSFFRIGSQSSPRAVDLNQDGVLDIVMGTAGNGEMAPTDQGVLAIDGKMVS